MSRGLTQAILSGRFTHVKYLVDSGICLNLKTLKHESVLITALKIGDFNKRIRFFGFLISRGADCCAVDTLAGRDVLSWACVLQRTEEIKVLLSHALCDINFRHQDLGGYSALHHAVIAGNEEITRLLVSTMQKFHVSVDIKDNWGVTPYHHATGLGFFKIANILIKEGGACFSSLQDYSFTKRKNAERSKSSSSYQEISIKEMRHSYERVPKTATGELVKQRKCQTKPKTSQNRLNATSLASIHNIYRDLSSLLEIHSEQLTPGYRIQAKPIAKEPAMKAPAMALVFAAKMRRKARMKLDSTSSPCGSEESYPGDTRKTAAFPDIKMKNS